MVGVVRADAPAPLDVAPVWSGHPVGFALLTSGDRQFVGFYDAARRLTVAVRSLDERTWTLVPLPRTTGWDSHNFIALAVDRAGFVHLAADMHCSPLVYFRSRHPLDEPFSDESFEPLHRMTGDHEDRVTYPVFLHDDAGDLVFMYRHGASGDGDQIVNRYDAAARAWRRLVDAPLTCGRRGDTTMNAYFEGPIRGPDGWFHLAWRGATRPTATPATTSATPAAAISCTGSAATARRSTSRSPPTRARSSTPFRPDRV